DLLKTHGAVSAPVALAMATGALKAAKADLALAITGIAGPGGGTTEKPVGLVHIAAARRKGKAVETRQIEEVFPGNRDQIRLSTVEAALKLGIEMTQDDILSDNG
ncbi:MAG: CinA family protein, partial [Rhodospirillaceae bacterium]|nr:CinA family protein [Rhodospirillaceae bacterium]